jgi:hypothetical protein
MRHIGRVSLLLLLLICAFAASLAANSPAPHDSNALFISDPKHSALQMAEAEEEATEHAPISHEKPPAALEDVDDYIGEPGTDAAGGDAVSAENEMENENVDIASKRSPGINAMTLSASYPVAVPMLLPDTQSEVEIPQPGCIATAGAEECSGHGMCKLNQGAAVHFCECTEGWFGPHCQCGEQADECSESNNCHWCGSLSLCLMSQEECEAGEIALHGQVLCLPQTQSKPLSSAFRNITI